MRTSSGGRAILRPGDARSNGGNVASLDPHRGFHIANPASLSSARPAVIPQFPIDAVRSRFPALDRAAPFVFFDNAAGSQAPQHVLDAFRVHLLDFNVQRGGRYAKSEEVDRVIAAARQKVATWINAREAAEVCFGMNATSFIRTV